MHMPLGDIICLRGCYYKRKNKGQSQRRRRADTPI